ncbi:uncharacterized protein LOC119688805 [Teleopsis dalmanni]|uniref:uncharacterized protein LOC119688805 n=1 Tax=Teleopsis dalmanni TaxID=139649 RepID=UPI0018CC94FA|nr:uncharacterized protein LOC119688805 [Teleopsis dalmanni]
MTTEKKENNWKVMQDDRVIAVQTLLKNFKKDSVVRKTNIYNQQRLQKLKDLRDQFEVTHEAIVSSSKDRTSEYFVKCVSENFDEAHLEAFCTIQESFEKVYPPPQSAPVIIPMPEPVAHIKLPTLPVPTFSGKCTDWPAFHDAFERLIHTNKEISLIQKFHFLKKALPDDNDLDIHNMQLTEANYPIAWELVVTRYNNPRILFMHVMKDLFSIPSQLLERAADIKLLLNTAKVCVHEFARLKIPITGSDHWLAYYISTKLCKETRKAWELHLGSNSAIPTFATLESFLNDRAVTLDVLESRDASIDITPNANIQPFRNSLQSKRQHKKSHHSALNTSLCPLCQNNHVIRRCHQFLNKDCFERKSIASRLKLCLNCLCRSHTVSQCPSTKNCQQCGQRHHTLLHFPPLENSAKPNSNVDIASHNLSNKVDRQQHNVPSPQTFNGTPFLQSNTILSPDYPLTTADYTEGEQQRVLLATALVSVKNELTNQAVILRALVDQGSECTLISEHATQGLGLKRYPTRTEIVGVGQSPTEGSKSVVTFVINSLLHSDFQLVIKRAYVLKSLTSLIPGHSICIQNLPHLNGLRLADPTYFKPGKIDLILGADVYAQLILAGLRIGASNQPIAQQTHLGWIISGNIGSALPKLQMIRCHHTSHELDNLVKNYFEQDQVIPDRELSSEEQWCEDFFIKTHSRLQNGCYMVRLPLKSHFDPTQILGRSRQIALNRLLNLERKLARNSDLQEQYHQVINEYFSLGHATRADSTEQQRCKLNQNYVPINNSYVLPHHAVLKEESLTTKLRIVFDASCKTSNGKSLNNILCVGPKLQNDLAAVLINWRLHQYVFVADIEKMYRCISMHPDDAQFQRILWRNNDGLIQEYCLNTVTFGTASAPYTAIRVIQQIAEDEKSRFPLAESVLKSNIYVDDILYSNDSLDMAVKVRDEVIAALKSAGMHLRKFCSNDLRILQGLHENQLSNTKAVQLNQDVTIKTLGMWWHNSGDEFKFNWNILACSQFTKRKVLSTIARLFDPLGLLNPILVTGKIIFKAVCSYQHLTDDQKLVPLDWDDPLPFDLENQWQGFLMELQNLKTITIPRWLGYHSSQVVSLQIHTFCDGSSKAFATSIYFRIQFCDGKILTRLVMSKSRSTPMKPLTIPRVELCGAVLGTQLTAWVIKHTSILTNNVSQYYWTDAQVVLHWIKGDPHRWKTAVSNRVGQILRVTSASQWYYVNTFENPADCATRGLTVHQLNDFDLWWNGPKWLQLPEEAWPTYVLNNNIPAADLELKRSPIRANINVVVVDDAFASGSVHNMAK